MSLLNCLASAIPGRERVITCEEVFELSNPGLVRTSGEVLTKIRLAARDGGWTPACTLAGGRS